MNSVTSTAPNDGAVAAVEAARVASAAVARRNVSLFCKVHSF
jgi:hypothetical protein